MAQTGRAPVFAKLGAMTRMTPFDLASDNAELDVANLLSPSAMAQEGKVDLSTSSIGPQTQYPDVARSPQPRRGNENCQQR